MERVAKIERKTKETDIKAVIDLDGIGKAEIDTEIGFFNHMLNSFFVHGRFDGRIYVKGDTDVDYHHSVEDTGIVLGMAFDKALNDKKGIKRFGTAFVPMDETLVMASVDLSGRPYLVFDLSFPVYKTGDMDTELIEEFFRAFAFNSKMTMHLKLIHGKNSHHIAEALFKASAIAIKQACQIDDKMDSVPSTKGIL